MSADQLQNPDCSRGSSDEEEMQIEIVWSRICVTKMPTGREISQQKIKKMFPGISCAGKLLEA